AEVVEATIPLSGQVTGRKVSEVRWPEGSVLVAQLHESAALVPGADDVLAAGDTIYALVSAKARRAFSRLLQD
ncbi:MAG: Trk system potassium transporter TrkA, partial [Verrucomicrobia bacterium]|nr:Trk system potassium transporter TrkA [Verrucomicrobiota bacterium]